MVAAPQRPHLPGAIREALHKRLEELIEMYDGGAPLWLVQETALTGTSHNVVVRIEFREGVI